MLLDLCARLSAGALFACLLAGCDRGPTHPSLADATLTPLIPAHEFVFNHKGYGGFSFSPDGSKLAWYGPSGFGSRRALHVRDETSGTVHAYRAGGSSTHWSVDSRRLLILDDKSGAENHHLLRLDVNDPNARPVDLTPYPGVRVWLFQMMKNDTEHVLVLHNRRSPTVRDLYRINLSTGEEVEIAQNPGDGISPVVDESGKFLGWRKPPGPGRARGKPLPPDLRERSALSTRTPEITRPVGISADRRQAWILSNRNRDRIALFHADASRKQVELIHEESDVDIAGVVMSEARGTPLLVTSHGDYPRSKILDNQLSADLEPLLASYGNARIGFEIVSKDPSERRLVIAIYTHANRNYYLLDRTSRQTTRLGQVRTSSFGAGMAVPEAVHYAARDGMRIPAYLLRPVGASKTPLPMVILIHGGPWARVTWSDPDGSENMLRAQFLANRGYAVLVVNYRGSTGYGRAHMAAAVGQFGAAMQDDIVDGLNWAVEQGIADPRNVAVMGHSYGGYATLMALSQQPRMFSCGVDVSGPTNLVRLIEEFPSYWELDLAYWYSYVGDPTVKSDRERMERVSPIHLARQIESPVLILQGAKDVRVPVSQSSAMADELRRHGKRFHYLVLEDMGHSTGYWAHHLFVLRHAERFLADCLGGRAARFDRMEWAARLSGRLPLW